MVFSSLILCVIAADPGWQQVSNKEGVLLEQRPVSGSAFNEYRVTTDTDVTVGALCDQVFEWGSVSTDHEELTSRRLLEDHGDLRITYDQVATPRPVAPRDFAFALKRERQGGTCKLSFTTSNEKAPPLQRGWVRIERLHGYWLFEPRPAGTHLTYVLFSDPGGGLPSHLVHGPQRDAAVRNAVKGIMLSRQAMTGARRP